MLYSVAGVALGTPVDCGRYGTAISGEIEREDQITFLRASGHELVDAARDLPSTMITWYTPNYGVADGFGASAEHLMLAIERRGYEVRVQPSWEMSGQTYIQHILDRPFANGAVRIAYTPPHPGTWARRHPLQATLGFSMWEDSLLPHSFDAGLRDADAVAVPSRFCQQLFQDRIDDLGLEKTVHYVPLGVDAEDAPIKRTFQRGQQPFTVIHSASRSSEPRKGADVAYAAFKKAFGDQEDVKLVLRSRLNSFHDEPMNDMRVTFMPGSITDEARTAIYHRAHVLLYPSRGEGFGLIPLEAIATGLPAIVSDGSALSEYRDLFHPIPTRPAPSEISVAIQPKSEGEWHEPDVDAAAAQLRRIYENYEPAAAAAMNAAAMVRRQWNCDRSGAALSVAVEAARAARQRSVEAADGDRTIALRQHAVAHNA